MEITNINFVTDKLSSKLTLALVSDLHNGPEENIVSILEEMTPDLILMPGDILDFPPTSKKPHQKNSFSFLKKAASIAPSFMSIGNHEGFLSNKSIFSIKETGVTLLDNQDFYYSFGHDGIRIGGLSSPCGRNQSYSRWYTPAPDLVFLDRFSSYKDFKLLLSHHPEYYPRYIKSRNIDLTLSGHAHGGQIRLFGQGLFSPGQGIFPRLTSGLYDQHLIVSRGLGNQTPYPRLFNSFQIIFVQLNPKD